MDDLKGRILAHAFHDELEKIAGLSRAVQQGGGGAYGKSLRLAHQKGKETSLHLGRARTSFKTGQGGDAIDRHVGNATDAVESGVKFKRRAQKRTGATGRWSGRRGLDARIDARQSQGVGSFFTTKPPQRFG
jgi:hypothetical protein